eukprot:TRINITY_DN8602_c0_g1_i1.p1 TRINITY_DN8602_c0_g1~~TRINITY_DN8602_c0_g1_i1.p1  ORF type:complete len:327 (-),score=42.45 TRINITY_DN8602_c0_g1_i1:7-987(-)
MTQATTVNSGYKYKKVSWLTDSPALSIFVAGTWNEEDNLVQLWSPPIQLADGNFEFDRVFSSAPHSGDVNDIKVLPNMRSFVTSSSTGRLTLYSVSNDFIVEESKFLKGHNASATSLDSLGNNIVSVDEQGKLVVVSLPTFAISSQKNSVDSSFRAVRFHSHSSFVTASRTDGRLWDLVSLRPTINFSWKREHSETLQATTVNTARPNQVAFSTSMGGVALFDIRRPERPFVFRRLHKSFVWDIGFHPMEPSVFISAANDGHVILWDTSSNLAGSVELNEHEIEPNLFVLHRGSSSVNSFSINPMLNCLLTSSDNGNLHLLWPLSS